MNTFTKTLAAAVVSATLLATGALAQDKEAGPSTDAGMEQMMQGNGGGMHDGNMMEMMPQMMQMMQMMQNCNQMMEMMQSMHGEPEGAESNNG